MRKLSLDQLTVVGIAPLEMIRIAAEVGYDAISPIALSAPEFNLPIQPFADDDVLCAAMARALRTSGICVNNVDGFPLFAHTDPNRFERPFDNLARLGASFVTTLILDSEESRAMDRFSRLCELARSVGLRVLLEFTPITHIRDLAQATQWLTRAGCANSALQLDAYHFGYTGSEPRDVATIDPRWVVSAQLCDAPLRLTAEQYAFDVLYERLLPGTGALPLVEFVRELPPDVPLGVEVPMKSLSDRGVPALDRARLAFDATLRILAKVPMLGHAPRRI